MKNKILKIFLALIFTSKIFGGHHFESDLAKKNPQLDLTDIFVFKSPNTDKTVFIMAFNPRSQKDSLSNYSTNGIYRFYIGFDPAFSKGFSPTFTFKDGKIKFYISNVAEPSIAELGAFIGEGPVNRELKFSNGINLWSGTVLDLFFGNSKGINVFRNNMNEGIFDLSAFDVGEEGNVFKSLASSVIVFEIPNKLLPKNIYYYASTALEEGPNHWHRVNRIGHVLFPHTYLLDKDMKIKYLNSNHEVQNDVKIAIYNNVLQYVTAAGLQKDPKGYTESLLSKIYPDVMTYTVGTEADYTINLINGRPLRADAMDVTLGLLIGSSIPIDDKVGVNLERYQDVFPYVVPIDKSYTDAKNKVVNIDVNALNINFHNNEDIAQNVTKTESDNSVLIILIVVLLLIITGFVIRNKKK